MGEDSDRRDYETQRENNPAETINSFRLLKRLSAEISEKLVWNVNELDGARAKHPPNANDSCGRGRGSGDAIRFDRSE
jgi:hypothetical protein